MESEIKKEIEFNAADVIRASKISLIENFGCGGRI